MPNDTERKKNLLKIIKINFLNLLYFSQIAVKWILGGITDRVTHAGKDGKIKKLVGG